MEEINIEILPYIFLNLPLQDILNCKLVCKKWLFALRHWTKIRELIVYVEEQPVNGKWENLRGFDCLHSLKLSSDRYLSRRNTKLNFEEALFSNLKKLFIQRRSLIEDADRCIEGLNKFAALEELILPTIQLHRDTRLSLQRLKVLTIDKVFSQRFVLFLDTPRLEQLRVFSNKRIEFSCESVSLKRMQVFHFYPSPVIASSLQYLFSYYLHHLADDFLQASKLRELHLFAESDTFAALKLQRSNLVGKDVQLYFKGVRMDGVNAEIESRLFNEVLDAKYLVWYLQNYDKLASRVPYLFIVKYDPFEQFADRLPANLPDFLSRFVALEKLVVKQPVKNEAKFIELLKCLRVESLKLQDSGLGQHFYSVKLPAICPRLESLKIVEEQPEMNQLDLEFIFGLKHLFDFSVSKNLKLDFVGRAFKELPNFRYFSFLFRDQPTVVNNLYRNDDYEFRLKLDDVSEKAHRFQTFEELASELASGRLDEHRHFQDEIGEEADGEEEEAEEDHEEDDAEDHAEDYEAIHVNRIAHLFLNSGDMNFRILDNENPDVRDMLQLGIDQREDEDELNREMADFDGLVNAANDQDSLDESEADPDFYHFRDL